MCEFSFHVLGVDVETAATCSVGRIRVLLHCFKMTFFAYFFKFVNNYGIREKPALLTKHVSTTELISILI
jgi:hypothetical protein